MANLGPIGQYKSYKTALTLPPNLFSINISPYMDGKNAVYGVRPVVPPPEPTVFVLDSDEGVWMPVSGISVSVMA